MNKICARVPSKRLNQAEPELTTVVRKQRLGLMRSGAHSPERQGQSKGWLVEPLVLLYGKAF